MILRKVIRLYPNKEQKEIFDRYLGAARFMYNFAIDQMEKSYKETGKTITGYKISKMLPEMKKTEEYKWLNDIDSVVLIEAIDEAHKAMTNFLMYHYGKPKFKKKKDSFGSRLRLFQEKGKVNMAILTYIKAQRNIDIGRLKKPKYINIKKSSSGKYFLSYCYEVEDLPQRSIRQEQDLKEFGFTINRKVGIDVGLKSFITTSDGYKIESPQFLKKGLKHIAHLQREVSRKPSDSNNRKKAIARLKSAYEKVCNQRHDFIHKVTKSLVTNYDEIHIESLNVERLRRTSKAKATRRTYLDVCLGEFFFQLDYKSQLYGCTLIKADPRFPSSQLCSNCGYKNPLVKNLNVREWDCPECGSHHDRDINAAINLLNYYPPIAI